MSTAGAEKSRPVTRAPRRAHDMVSMPEVALEVDQVEPGDVADDLELEGLSVSRPALNPSRS